MNSGLKYRWIFLLLAMAGDLLISLSLPLFYKGYSVAKMSISALGNPKSPVSFELRVVKEIHAAEGSDIFLCEICNVMIEEKLKDKSLPFMERLKLAAPVLTAGETTYTSLDGRELGRWGLPMKSLTD